MAISGVLFSCAKEELDYGKLNLIGDPKPITVNATLPKSAGVDKTLVDGEGKVKWELSDSITVNSSVLRIKRLVTDTLAEFQGTVGSLPTPAGKGYWATYPDVLSPRAYNARSVTVTLPTTQDYRKNDTIQNYMAAFDTANGACLDLQFRNLCSIVKIPVQTFENVTGEEAELHSIDVEVVNPSGKYLAGEATVTWNSGNRPGLSFSKASNRSSMVTLNCNDIDVHSQKTFSIMLPAQQNCTFKVTFHHGKCLVTEKTISNASLVRNTIYTTSAVTLDTIVPGGFSVSPTKKVYFSPGNLQWSAKNGGSTATTHAVAGGGTAAGTWRFAEHQWDCIGNAAGNNTAAASRETQAAWIDLFGWGTSGYDNTAKDQYAINFQPWASSEGTVNATYNNHGYGPSTNMTNRNLVGTSANYDWGVYNAIYNPKTNTLDAAGTWRTPTKDEWDYIISTRTTCSGVRYAKATVADVPGLIIVPDNWDVNTYALDGTNTANVAYTVNNISSAVWTNIFEPAGCAFLPAAGHRYAPSVVGNVGIYGNYWSATYCDSHYAYLLSFGVNAVYPSNSNTRHYGRSVRLVQDAN